MHNRDSIAPNARRGGNPRRRRTPPPSIYINSLAACRAAVNALRFHSRIAVDCEGVALSRTGRLCLLQMASPDNIYIIDLVSSNDSDPDYAHALFHEGGLKGLLEGENICKVMHDCRHDSDALYHQYGVKLGPVIDTQVVFSVLRRVRGMPEGLPVSLKTLLKKFAGATEEELLMKNTVKESMQGNGDFWLKRPLPQQALLYARLDVEYLLSISHLLSKYIEGADKNAWEMVLKESQGYVTVFRDDQHGPRKAQKQYEQMARVARRQRLAHERTKRVKIHQSVDPMRKFTFDHTLILQSLTI